MTKVRSALVIGGGIAGPVAAMALRKAGIEATIYEAYPGTTDGVGGTLAIAPNGLAALGVVGADEAVKAIAEPQPRMVMEVGGRRIAMLPSLADLPPLQLLWRNDLHRVLHDLAKQRGIVTEYGKRVVEVQDLKDGIGGIKATFADGSTATADVLIGADGVRSTVRTLIDPDAPGPRYTGMLGFGAEVDFEADSEPGTMHFVFGRKAYYLYNRLRGGGTLWGANLPFDRPMSLVEARAVPPENWIEKLREAYGDEDPGGQFVRHTTPENLTIVGGLHIMPSVPRWWWGRMVLVGDSVHAPSNSSGQGASLAIESAVQIARCLRDLPDPASAFTAFERLRRDRVEAVAKRAARINHAKAPGPIARAIMPTMMKIMMKTVMRPEGTMAREQRYRIDFDEKVSGC
ncbi:MAG TPA: NAD(P)/FAD-dependent oxidoreductase [Candidatus Limnocylindrales bacterium]